MADIWMDVDTALSEVPVNLMPLLDDTDGKTIEGAVAYNAAGLALFWHFVTTDGVYNNGVAVTPTSGGAYDWTDHGTHGIYTIEIPASGGASINNDTEGFGWFTGVATGVLPWRGPVIGFRAAALNNALIDSATGLNDFADALLKRDMSAVSGESARSPLNAFRKLRNRWAVGGGTLTVYKEDDTTSAYTEAVSSDAAAEPITGSNPD
jgi:hypothetical protein